MERVISLAVKKNMSFIDYFSSDLAPLSGELPKAEGAAQAVYFTMNISSVLGATRSYRLHIKRFLRF